MADLTTYLISVNSRKHQIQKDQIRVKNMELLQGFLAVIYDFSLKAFFCKVESYQLCNIIVIVNNEDFLFCSHDKLLFYFLNSTMVTPASPSPNSPRRKEATCFWRFR